MIEPQSPLPLPLISYFTFHHLLPLPSLPLRLISYFILHLPQFQPRSLTCRIFPSIALFTDSEPKETRQPLLQASNTTPPDMADPQQPTADIYAIVASKMGMPVAARTGIWECLPGLYGSDFHAFLRESTTAITGRCDILLRAVATAAVAIMSYCIDHGWSHEFAASIVTQDTILGILVHHFEEVSRECDRGLAAIATRPSKWRAVALTNYLLVNFQFRFLAINPMLRKPAIADLSGFLAMNPHNFRPPHQLGEAPDDEDDSSSGSEFQ